MNSLKGKVIVITGGSGLLGTAFLKAIRSAGGIAINADVSEKNNISEGLLHCDITKEESVREAIKSVVDYHGQINGWINNAYPRTEDSGNYLEDLEVSTWNKNIDMHLNGYFICSKFVLEQMRKQGNGSLINMGSIYGILGPDFTIYEGTPMTNSATYSAIKGGLINFTRYCAAFYGKYNIRVNSISPGGIFDNQNDIFVKNYCHKTPLKRMGTPEDIAPSAVFLLSDQSSYITGHNLVIDGGWSIV